MSTMYYQFSDGRALPVDPRFVPVCTLDDNGLPVPMFGAGSGASEQGQATLADYLFARKGSEFVADTVPHAGQYCGLVAITDVQISAITLTGVSTGAGALSGKTLIAGQVIYAPFTSVTLTSGTAQLIKSPVA